MVNLGDLYPFKLFATDSRVLLMGIPGKVCGGNENWNTYVVDQENGALTLLHHEEYSMTGTVSGAVLCYRGQPPKFFLK